MGLWDRVTSLFTGELSASDPRVLEAMGGPFGVDTGLPAVSEWNALSIPAYSRGEDIIVSTIAGLPLKAYEKRGKQRFEVLSVLDEPQGPSAMTRNEWLKTLYTHLVRYREAYLKPIFTADGVMVGIELINPKSVEIVKQSGWGKTFEIRMANNDLEVFTSKDIRQVLVPPFVGALRGSPVYVFSKPLFQTAIAAMTGIGKVFTGAMIAGLVTPRSDDPSDWPDEQEAQLIMDKLNGRLTGTSNAGQFRMINRALQLDRWQQTNDEAQFSEAQDDVTEGFARLLGIPPHLLAQTDKQTSWGTGVAEQNLGLSRYTLTGYSDAVESALKSFLPLGVYAETDYKGLLSGTPKDEIELLLAETGSPILTVDEARQKLNLPPMPVQPATQEAVPDGLRD